MGTRYVYKNVKKFDGFTAFLGSDRDGIAKSPLLMRATLFAIISLPLFGVAWAASLQNTDSQA
jgi:hypothetical protein